jgi:hypothetical protein
MKKQGSHTIGLLLQNARLPVPSSMVFPALQKEYYTCPVLVVVAIQWMIRNNPAKAP